MESRELTLVISNPEDGRFLQNIVWNREQFMSAVSAIADEYRGLTYTDDQIGIAKEDRAKLNKAKKLISDRRIEVKKAINAPYEQFEAEIREGVAKIDEVVDMIDGQIKEYEHGKREEKKAKIQTFFNVCVKDVHLPMEPQTLFDDLFDDRWLNATVSLKKAQEELQEKLDKIETDLDTIERVEESYRRFALGVYAKTRDISHVLNEVAKVQESKREAEEFERRRKEAEEQARKEIEAEAQAIAKAAIEGNGAEAAQSTAQEDNETGTQGTSMEAQNIEHEPVREPQKVYRTSFTVHGTLQQIEDLKRYMDNAGMRYERAN